MSCEPTSACAVAPARLGLVPPAPGQSVLRRRLGEYDGFTRDLIARIESRVVDGEPLGRRWDVEGDPHASALVELWAYVAEVVAAYAELTAAESYLGTASAWADLRRLAGLVGYRPRPRIAAQGWIRAEVDKGSDPLLPAGTRVQAPGTATRPSQTFEVAADTQLRSDWNQLTATWVPIARKVEGRSVRFLGDPGFAAGDLVLFVREEPTSSPYLGSGGMDWSSEKWSLYQSYVLSLASIQSEAQPLAVASVVSLASELGTTVVEFDRELGAEGLLDSAGDAYAAYRVLDSAGEARRLTNIVTVRGSVVSTPSIASAYGSVVAVTPTSIVLDAALEELSAGQTVGIVAWSHGLCDVVEVARHSPISWNVAPGTPTRASKLEFEEPVPTLRAAAGGLTVYVVDRRVVARHYEFPAVPQGTTQNQLRLYPAPALDPERIAVETVVDGRPTWEVLACERASAQEAPAVEAPIGLIVDLVEGQPRGTLLKARASANLAPVRHGATTRAVLGSGEATRPRQAFELPDAPIAYDVDAAGSVVPTQVLRVDGIAWSEVASLFGAGPAEAFAVRLEEDGGLTVQFGDGEQGSRLPTGRGNVTTTYRVGGGTQGEVEGGAIDSLLGSVRGVKKVEGAGPTTGGADQDDERRLRRLAPARARALGRAVSIGDLVDLSLGYPGVTHAAAWHGTGPPGCACGRPGLHLAFVRAGAGGVRAPAAAEIAALASFLDARRDATVPLCVCAAVLTEPRLRLTVELAVDPRRLAADVVAAATAALADPDGPLAPLNRVLGQPLDRSDVFAVLHGVDGVLGVPSLDVPGAAGELGRRAAARHELIVLDPSPIVGGAAA